MKAVSHSRRLTLAALVSLGALIAFTAFKLFEPVFVYTAGWYDLPGRADMPLTSEAADPDDPRSEQAGKLLLAAYENGAMPSISVAIGSSTGVIWRGVVGYAELETGTRAGFDHAYRIGSTSKALTSIAVGQLVARGALTLDQELGPIAPDLPEHLHAITLGQIMSHRAGVRNYGLCLCFPVWEYYNRREFESLSELASDRLAGPLLFEPGSHYAYTSLGYNLAGLFIEHASGSGFSDAVSTLVLTPAGASHSGLDGSPGLTIVQHYDVVDGRYKPVFDIDNSIRGPSGGMVSTPTDLVHIGGMMLDDAQLATGAREELLSIPESGRDNGGEIYAHGWRVYEWPHLYGRESLTYNHNGVGFGGRSIFAILPEHDLIISVVTNQSGESIDDLVPLTRELVDLFMASHEGG